MQLPFFPQPTMSSREIADLVESRHADVVRSIQKMISDGIIEGYTPQAYTHPQNGQTYECYMLNKRDSYVVVARFSPEFTARIVDRWQELEKQAIPQTFAQALRLAAEQQEQIEAQQLLIEQQKPAVEFVERYVEAKSTKGLREVAKVLGAKEKEFVSFLIQEGIMFRQGKALLPYASLQHHGYFEVKTGESNGFAYHQSKFTPQGIAWIAKKWGEHAA